MPSHSTQESTPLLPTSHSDCKPIETPVVEHVSRLSIICLVLGAMCNSLSSLFIHIALAKYGFPTTSAVLIRSLVGTFISILAIAFLQPPMPPQPHLLVYRALSGGASLITSYAALKQIPVGIAATIFSMSPVLTSILCAVTLSESLRRVDIFALVVSFAGVVLVAQPRAEMNQLHGDALLGVMLALMCAILSSLSFTLVRKMSISAHPLQHTFSVSLTVGIWAVASSHMSDFAAILTNLKGSLAMVVASLLGFLGMIFFISGLQRCKASISMVVKSLSVPLSFLWGWIFLHESGNWIIWCGVTMVVGSSIGVGWNPQPAKKSEADEDLANVESLPSMKVECINLQNDNEEK